MKYWIQRHNGFVVFLYKALLIPQRNSLATHLCYRHSAIPDDALAQSVEHEISIHPLSELSWGKCESCNLSGFAIEVLQSQSRSSSCYAFYLQGSSRKKLQCRWAFKVVQHPGLPSPIAMSYAMAILVFHDLEGGLGSGLSPRNVSLSYNFLDLQPDAYTSRQTVRLNILTSLFSIRREVGDIYHQCFKPLEVTAGQVLAQSRSKLSPGIFVNWEQATLSFRLFRLRSLKLRSCQASALTQHFQSLRWPGHALSQASRTRQANPNRFPPHRHCQSPVHTIAHLLLSQKL